MVLPWDDLSEGCHIEAPSIRIPWTITSEQFSEIIPCKQKSHLCPGAVVMKFLQPTEIVRACGGCGTHLVCNFTHRLFGIGFNFCELPGAQPVEQTIRQLEQELESRHGESEDQAARLRTASQNERTWLIDKWRVRLGRFPSEPYLVVEIA